MRPFSEKGVPAAQILLFSLVFSSLFWLPLQGQVLPKMPVPDTRLWVADLSRASRSECIAAACLQGIINRRKPRIYLIGSAYDEKWLGWLLERRYITQTQRLPDMADLVERFRSELKGAVLWDPSVAETINIATMEAGLRQGIAASPEDAARWRLPILLDLRGRWRTEAEALDWSLENLKPKMRSGLMASIYPGAPFQLLRDYAVAARVFTFWASDRAALEKVASRFPPNTLLIGYWGYGWPDRPDYRGLSEYDGLLLLSRYGIVSSGSEFSANWSVQSGVRVPDAAFRRAPLPPPPLDPKKVYVAIHVVESGDALWYWQMRQRDIWENPALGSVPMGWSVNPTAQEAFPAILEWYYRRAPANQEFYGAISGMGYFSAPDFGQATGNVSAVWDTQARSLRQSLKRLSLRGVAMWMGPWRVPDNYQQILDHYASRLPEADFLLPDVGRAENIPYDQANYLLRNCAVFHCRSRWRIGPPTDPEGEIAWLTQEIRAQTPAARPAFLSVMAYSWTHDPATVRAVMERLGDEYIAVTPSQLSALYRKQAQAQASLSKAGKR
jgi:hypothetical protein